MSPLVPATLSALVPAVMAVAGSGSAIILPGGISAIVAGGLPACMPARATGVGFARGQRAFDPRRRRNDLAALGAAQVDVRPV